MALECYASYGLPLGNRAGIPLTAGTSAIGDGAVLQVGYYSGATLGNPFSGQWIALSGPGTPLLPSSVGDGLSQIDGVFKLSFSLVSGFAGEPPVGTPLSLRFYDSQNLSTARYFNSVTGPDGSWNWPGIGTVPHLGLAIDAATAPTLVWQGGAGSAFRTTLPVPEPGVALLLVAGGAGWVWRRRRAGGVMAAGRCR